MYTSNDAGHHQHSSHYSTLAQCSCSTSLTTASPTTYVSIHALALLQHLPPPLTCSSLPPGLCAQTSTLQDRPSHMLFAGTSAEARSLTDPGQGGRDNTRWQWQSNSDSNGNGDTTNTVLTELRTAPVPVGVKSLWEVEGLPHPTQTATSPPTQQHHSIGGPDHLAHLW